MAHRIDTAAAFFNGRLISGVIYHADGSKEKRYLRGTTQWLYAKCPSVVSDENKGRPTCRYGGMEARALSYA